jgi:hypothetical protein
MLKRDIVHLTILIGSLLQIIAMGCLALQSSTPGNNMTPPDPETGIQTWVAAVNAHDVTALYYLAPEGLREQVTLDQFKIANVNNTFFADSRSISGYEVLNKTGNASMANIHAVILLQQTFRDNSSQTETIPVYLNFQEWFEDGKWKVWTIPWS